MWPSELQSSVCGNCQWVFVITEGLHSSLQNCHNLTNWRVSVTNLFTSCQSRSSQRDTLLYIVTGHVAFLSAYLKICKVKQNLFCIFTFISTWCTVYIITYQHRSTSTFGKLTKWLFILKMCLDFLTKTMLSANLCVHHSESNQIQEGNTDQSDLCTHTRLWTNLIGQYFLSMIPVFASIQLFFQCEPVFTCRAAI